MSGTNAATIPAEFNECFDAIGGLQSATVSDQDQPLKLREAGKRCRVVYAQDQFGRGHTLLLSFDEPTACGVKAFADFHFVEPLLARAVQDYIIIDPNVRQRDQLVEPEQEYDLFVHMPPLRIQKRLGKIVKSSKATPNPIF